MTNVVSIDYTHSHPSINASLFGNVHCPFSPRVLEQTSPVHPNPVIQYTLSHINLLISSSKQPPYLPIMAFPQPFQDILPCNFPLFRYYDTHHHCHIALHDHVVDIIFEAKPLFIIFSYMSLLIHRNPGTPPEAFIQRSHRNTYAILREVTSETYAPRVYFPSYKFSIYFILQSFTFNLYHKISKIFILLSLSSLSDLTLTSGREGIDNPLSRWLRGYYLCVQVRGDSCVVSYWIDILVLKN